MSKPMTARVIEVDAGAQYADQMMVRDLELFIKGLSDPTRVRVDVVGGRVRLSVGFPE
ncbi:hypothetical protein BH790_gp70 [Gordonia phage Gsput1]|uniref:Uncharacterized protein n=1 Tax=Gordonia phage Gsput1 TaxID=1622193 RepID=A0A0E3T8C2_9CAUD|nr:hypothetical protein BH790_gp70 [Gordonia phage Gsput1]AKC03095.1 hypothetical protein Gsput1_70 [Gordonia phage Gsput1]